MSYTYAYQQAKKLREDRVSYLVNLFTRFSIHIALIILSLTCLIPLLLIVSASFTKDIALTRNGYSLIPSEFSTYAYEFILLEPTQILKAYGLTLFTTITGTAGGLLIMSMLAYALSRQDFWLRKPLSLFIFITMLFNGGLVPFYILVTRYLGWKNNLLALIVPGMVGVWYVLLLRTYFSQLPSDLLDAARVDGAGEWRIFFQIVLPLSRPALAAVGLMLALGYWNDWTSSLYFTDNPDLSTLQYLLYRIMQNIQFISANSQAVTGLNLAIPVEPVRMAMAVLATGPAAVAFLAVQKYLVQGITLGALK